MRPPIVLYAPPKRLRTDYRVGLSAWTDRSMLEEGEFYPKKTMSAEERLWWYSRFFDSVEVNSSFYALPSRDVTALWVERTPPGFLFSVKAWGLLTGHDVEASRLPEEVKKTLPAVQRDRRGRISNERFGPEARAWALTALRDVLTPLRQAGKLGYVLFQLAPSVKFSDATLAYLSRVAQQLAGMTVAVEFRNRSWFGARTQDTLRVLAEHGLTYVAIDGPRSRALVPSLPALTTPTAVFRLHGRNFEGHLKQLQGQSPTVAEKYDYLYSTEELEEVARTAGALNGRAERVYLQMNNNNRDYPVKNGMQLKEMLLESWEPPDRQQLIEELEERRARARGRPGTRKHAASRR